MLGYKYDEFKETSVHLLETQGWTCLCTSTEPTCPRLEASLDPGSLPEELLISHANVSADQHVLHLCQPSRRCWLFF